MLKIYIKANLANSLFKLTNFFIYILIIFI